MYVWLNIPTATELYTSHECGGLLYCFVVSALNVEDTSGVLETSILRPCLISNTLGLTNKGLHSECLGLIVDLSIPICHSF